MNLGSRDSAAGLEVATSVRAADFGGPRSDRRDARSRAPSRRRAVGT
jgi:hypothetical protein